MRVKMIATRGMTYGTRRLMAKEEFEANSSSDARILEAIGRAKPAPDKPAASTASAPKPAQKTADKPTIAATRKGKRKARKG